MSLFHLENVTYAWPGGEQVLHGISFTMEQGENLGILGESGSGKSTLLRLMLGLDRPSGGRIEAEDLDSVEEALISADLGPTVAARIVSKLAEARLAGEIDMSRVRQVAADEIAAILAPLAKPLLVTAFFTRNTLQPAQRDEVLAKAGEVVSRWYLGS